MKIKKIITLIIPLFCLSNVAVIGQDHAPSASITSETNAPRAGDHIEKLLLQPISIRQSGDSLLWDLSSHKTGKQYEIRYRESPDGKIIEDEGGIVRYYQLLRDTLYLTRHGQPGMSVLYPLPEPVATYPMSYGSSQSGFFYGEGRLGNQTYIRNAGYSTTTVDSRGTLVTPGGDTIKNVLRSHYTRTGTTHTDDNFRQSFMSTRDSSLFLSDSIRHWLSTDSITHRIERWRWYAPGYRYPIAEAEKYKIYYYNTPVDSVNRYYYYRAIDQQYDIEDDYPNEQIRYINSSGDWYAANGIPNQSPRSRFPDSWGGNTSKNNKGPYSNRTSTDDSGAETLSGSGTFANYPYSIVSPTIVTGSTAVRYGTDTISDVSISLHNTAGAIVWQYDSKNESGDYSVTCPMDAFPAGDYLMVTRIGDKVFPAKLIKR